jgi:hypothetical protein
LKKKLLTLKLRAGDKGFNLEYNMNSTSEKNYSEMVGRKYNSKNDSKILVGKGFFTKYWGERFNNRCTGYTRVNSEILIRKG